MCDLDIAHHSRVDIKIDIEIEDGNGKSCLEYHIFSSNLQVRCYSRHSYENTILKKFLVSYKLHFKLVTVVVSPLICVMGTCIRAANTG